MDINISLFSPVVLILIGVGYLLANLGLIPITPWQAFIQYWPALLIWYGVANIIKGLFDRSRRVYINSGEIGIWLVLGLVGVYLLLPRIGLDVIPVSWNVIWPILLILVGLSNLFKVRSIFSVDSDHGGARHSRHKTPHSSFVFVGEINRSGHSWVLDDLNVRHGVGEVHLDLTQAVIPERETRIEVSGLVGEVVIYIPSDLPLKAHCSTGVGEITVLDQHTEGMNRSISLVTPGYENAVRKVKIDIRWKIGEIKIRRIG